ncbi:hypothetical protein AKI39_05135 [Bordetella sp. H567]|nr:hypothetical protein AKI39_05135 [Bordetella sp. H567]
MEWVWILPLACVLYYPWALSLANRAYTNGNGPTVVVAWLMTAYAVPAFAFFCAYKVGTVAVPTARIVLARRLCCLAFAAPPAYTLVGVLLYLMKIELPDIAVWTTLWLSIAMFGLMTASTARPGRSSPGEAPRRIPVLRTLHGVTALLLLLAFLGPHIFNHLLGVFGTDVHRSVMKALRTFYRSPIVEPAILAAMLFQILSGLVLFNRKGSGYLDLLGTLQVTSGAYLAMFIPTHVNSVFTLARYFGTETDYAWAVGAPVGVLADPWNIRLLPHYSLGVFLLIAHLACGLRLVLRAHGMDAPKSNIVTWFVVAIGGAIAAMVTAGMLGWRLSAAI